MSRKMISTQDLWGAGSQRLVSWVALCVVSFWKPRHPAVRSAVQHDTSFRNLKSTPAAHAEDVVTGGQAGAMLRADPSHDLKRFYFTSPALRDLDPCHEAGF